MPTIEDAIRLANEHHGGQQDKAGLPYILHPLRAMGHFVLPEESDERIVAVLHDIVEDTTITLAILHYRGYSDLVVDAIDAISRRPDETYDQYMQRLSNNPLAVRVKLADLADNLDPRRRSTSMLMPARLEKYRSAVAYLHHRQIQGGKVSVCHVER